MGHFYSRQTKVLGNQLRHPIFIKILKSFEHIYVHSWNRFHRTKNGGCQVGGVGTWQITKGVPTMKFVRVQAWTLIAQTTAAPTTLAR
jgi:hypothetical protein